MSKISGRWEKMGKSEYVHPLQREPRSREETINHLTMFMLLQEEGKRNDYIKSQYYN